MLKYKQSLAVTLAFFVRFHILLSSSPLLVGVKYTVKMDEFGESFLCVDEKEKARGLALMHSAVDNVASQLLLNDRKGLERLILEGTCGGFAHSRQDVSRLIGCTMAAAEQGLGALEPFVDAALQRLVLNKFVLQKEDAPFEYEPTPLGDATYHSCFSPEEALVVHADLAKARQGLVLCDELHLCFLMTPIVGLFGPDWGVFSACISTASEDNSHQRVLDSVGGSRSVIERRMRGAAAGADPCTDRALSRLYSALMLLELIHETPLGNVADKFHIPRGTLQTLMASASSFANMTVAFCKRLGWWDLEAVLGCYVKRLNWGVLPEIVPLTEVCGIGRSRARALWNAGFRTVRAIASAKPEDIVKHVPHLGPFKDRAARLVIKGARGLLERQARELQKQAEEILGATTSASTTPASPVNAALSRKGSRDGAGSMPMLKEESQLFGIGLEESLSDEWTVEDEFPLPAI